MKQKVKYAKSVKEGIDFVKVRWQSFMTQQMNNYMSKYSFKCQEILNLICTPILFFCAKIPDGSN